MGIFAYVLNRPVSLPNLLDWVPWIHLNRCFESIWRKTSRKQSTPWLASLPKSIEASHIPLGTISEPSRSILSHYSPNLTGSSIGHHIPATCPGPRCNKRPKEDGLNAAVSGSMAKSLVAQVRGVSLPSAGQTKSKSRQTIWSQLSRR